MFLGSSTWGSLNEAVWPERASHPHQLCCLCCGSAWRGNEAHLVSAGREADEDAPGRTRMTTHQNKIRSSLRSYFHFYLPSTSTNVFPRRTDVVRLVLMLEATIANFLNSNYLNKKKGLIYDSKHISGDKEVQRKNNTKGNWLFHTEWVMVQRGELWFKPNISTRCLWRNLCQHQRVMKKCFLLGCCYLLVSPSQRYESELIMLKTSNMNRQVGLPFLSASLTGRLWRTSDELWTQKWGTNTFYCESGIQDKQKNKYTSLCWALNK